MLNLATEWGVAFLVACLVAFFLAIVGKKDNWLYDVARLVLLVSTVFLAVILLLGA